MTKTTNGRSACRRANSARATRALLLGALLGLAAGTALADKPEWAGGGKGGKPSREAPERHDRDGGRAQGGVSFTFSVEDRRIVGDYFGAQARAGHCPPGLAKKGNGCLPPGQAKQWQRGRPLGRDVAYYDLPRDLWLRLPAPPPDYRYVRVAGDVLMIAVGTGMVVDAIEDILR